MASAAENDKSNYVKKYYKNKSNKINLLQSEAGHQKYKHEKINKYFTKSKTSKEKTINLDKSSDSNSLPSCESNNYSPKNGKKKTSITYDSDYFDDGKISSSSNRSKDRKRIDGCRYGFIIDKSTTNSKSKLR